MPRGATGGSGTGGRRAAAALVLLLLAGCNQTGRVETARAAECGHLLAWEGPLAPQSAIVSFDTPEAVRRKAFEYGAGGDVLAFRIAFSHADTQSCIVHLPLPQNGDACYATILRHELAHCQNGAWHDEPEPRGVNILSRR